MQKLAIFGGTFDPIHWGHLLIAQTALDQLRLDRVIWVIDRSPPHKQFSTQLDWEHRWEMVQLAIVDRPAFILSPITTHFPAHSYAIDTLNHLQAVYPQTNWHWIVGQDAFATLPRWYRRQELIPECHWLVAPRPNVSNIELELLGKTVVEQLTTQSIPIRWQVLSVPPVAISSSLIRQYCQEQRSIRCLVPEAVRTYIQNHQFYQSLVSSP
ncbi:nicotinate (nicotinamide) nucleotide adenylyltransferase [Phormidium sp. LEGE 05292]|uniref:nicotinate (nicotinamide) nucleotide adenylyltransferase n=1 Tax=[Phormidium] sp. LEGE 05292 TaxID=767427 RepID=UPI001882FC24|nr:nicotinate (nicotinamide) nucleotide adenylyltransferase [Phormidium sp. LEGE 05292]MBE9229873.1 nicotinate (nicotinamide) nucleotide adenylyltransferase [Phormidium sp. LEGE 05292]